MPITTERMLAVINAANELRREIAANKANAAEITDIRLPEIFRMCEEENIKLYNDDGRIPTGASHIINECIDLVKEVSEFWTKNRTSEQAIQTILFEDSHLKARKGINRRAREYQRRRRGKDRSSGEHYDTTNTWGNTGGTSPEDMERYMQMQYGEGERSEPQDELKDDGAKDNGPT